RTGCQHDAAYAEKPQDPLDVGENGPYMTDTLVTPSLTIVALAPLNTTSRAADHLSFSLISGVSDRVCTRFRRSGADSARGSGPGGQRGDRTHGLERRAGRTPEEALGGRALGEPDRGPAWRGHPQRGDR